MDIISRGFSGRRSAADVKLPAGQYLTTTSPSCPQDRRHSGKIRDHSKMETQMRQTYANAKKILSEFGATLDNVVEEVLYVTDMDIAFAVAGPVRKEAYGAKRPQVASTILVTPRLALPTQLIEIKFIAKVR